MSEFFRSKEHPDAKFQGKKARVEFEYAEGKTTTIEIIVSSTPAESWTDEPITLNEPEFLKQMRFKDLDELAYFSSKIENFGVKASIRQALRQIGYGFIKA